MNRDPKEVTTLLMGWRAGDSVAGDQLVQAVYGELRRLAAHYLAQERPGHTLQPTALVHELYLRLFASEPIEWQNRAHFFGVAAQQLRRLLIDHARAKHAEKRGGDRVKVSLTDIKDWPGNRDENLIVIDEALSRLEKLDQRAARVVELRFFAGITEKETAEVLGISPATVKRDWEFARAWLLTQLSAARDAHNSS